MWRGGSTPEQVQRRRRDVDQRGLLGGDRRGCRRTRPARAADRCSGRRSTPWCCPRTRAGDDAGGAIPRHAIAGVVADEQVRARSRGRARCRARRVERFADRRSRRVSASAQAAQLAMISAFNAAASAPGATMPLLLAALRLGTFRSGPSAVGARPRPVDVAQPFRAAVGPGCSAR